MDLSQDRLRNESSLYPVVLSHPQFEGVSVHHLTALLSLNKERRVVFITVSLLAFCESTWDHPYA